MKLWLEGTLWLLNQPQWDNTYRVTVKMAIDPEARIVILIGDEFVYIKDIVNTMVP